MSSGAAAWLGGAAPKLGTVGVRQLTIEYSGDDRVGPGMIQNTVRVVR